MAAKTAMKKPAKTAKKPAFLLHGSFLSTPTYKVGLMLALCKAPFAYRHIDLSKGKHKEPDFLALNRYGQVPVLSHGATVLCQSNVILRYLASTLGAFGAKNESDDWRIQEWLSWEADRLMPGVGRTRFFARFMKTDPAIVDYFRKAADMGLKTLDQQLGGRDFLLGRQASIADISCYADMVHAAEGNIDLAQWRNVSAWWGRVQKLPGFRHPYDLLPQADRD